MIPRADLFGNPERASGSVNSDGTRIGFLAPKDGVLNVFVIDFGNEFNLSSAICVTNDSVRGIRSFGWTEHPNVLYFLQDKGGDEDWKVYTVNVVTNTEVCLTPVDKTTSAPVGSSVDFPDTLLIMSNPRVADSLDLFAVNIHTGESKMILENDEKYSEFSPDHKFSSCIASRVDPQDSSVDMFYVKLDLEVDPASVTKASSGTHILHLSKENAGYGDTGCQGFSGDLQSIYLSSFVGRDTSAFVKFNILTQSIEKEYGSDPRADISGSLIDPVTHEPWAYQTNYDRKIYVAIDKTDVALVADFAALDAVAGDGGEWTVDSLSSDGNIWTVTVNKPDAAAKVYVYSRSSQAATLLFSTRPVLDKHQLHTMKSVEITTRDGLKMLTYLTIPKKYEDANGKYTTQPIPLIAHVHGGPYARDTMGFNRFHQFLADRGYGVISPQFRGSTGFGKAFLAAADREWAGKMHDDIIDSCDWAVANGIAIKEKIGIHGGSYGGYSALVGVTFTPEYFACSVDIVGPSNICTLLDSIPAYWGPIKSMFTSRIGADTDTEEGRAFLLSRSPISKVDNICRPLLIAQGANDPRVKQAESDQIFEAMVAKNIPVTYILYPDEGHGFARPENNISYIAVAEAFFAKHLGGDAEEVGEAFKGSSIEFKGGRAEIGL